MIMRTCSTLSWSLSRSFGMSTSTRGMMMSIVPTRGIMTLMTRSRTMIQPHSYSCACTIPKRNMMMMSRPRPKFFKDSVVIQVAGGRGGDGCTSFEGRALGKDSPDGGHGGRGGDVILVAKEHVRDFAHVGTFQIKGKEGKNGSGQGKTGKRGDDVYLQVPVGTSIYRAGLSRKQRQLMLDMDEEGNAPPSNLGERESRLIHDLSVPDEQFTVAHGGFPGRGNILQATRRFDQRISEEKASRDRVGREGTSAFLELRLKSIADACLVGYPNAGKSSLLGAVSTSKPKVAAYPFTTLHPHVGYLEFTDKKRTSLADLPGLVDGASQNRGMGHEFLQHVERCKVLVYVIDAAPESYERRQATTMAEDLEHLVRELDLYMKGLPERPSLVVVNKMDRPEAKQNFEAQREEILQVAPESCEGRIFPVSARSGEGLEEFVNTLRVVVEETKKMEDEQSGFGDDEDEDEKPQQFKIMRRIGRAVPGRRALLHKIKQKEATHGGELAFSIRGKEVRNSLTKK